MLAIRLVSVRVACNDLTCKDMSAISVSLESLTDGDPIQFVSMGYISFHGPFFIERRSEKVVSGRNTGLLSSSRDGVRS